MPTPSSSWLSRLTRLDRRWIFLLVLVCAVTALLIPIDLPIVASPLVRRMHDTVTALAAKERQKQSLPPEQRRAVRSTLLVSLDYDPASKPELEPMSRALLTDALCNGVKVVAMTLNQQGQDLGERVLFEVARQCKSVYGEDFVYLGFKAGGPSLIINMGQDFHDAYGKDFEGRSTATLAVTRDIGTLTDFGYVVCIAASAFWENWLIFGQSRYRFTYGAGVAGVLAPDVFPFLQSGQVTGLLGGLVGAAEYEQLIGRPDAAVAGMRPQSAVHLLIVALVLLGNVAYFVERRRQNRRTAGRR